MRNHYNIYPSLLDKFQKYLDSDKEFESFWNVGSDGQYKQSDLEIATANEQSLLDAINRVPHAPIPAADKGTCFNALVDAIHTSGECDFNYEILQDADGREFYRTTMNDATYDFDKPLTDIVAQRFVGAIAQYRCECDIETRYGTVTLYGYIDELMRDEVLDIKTTTMYDFGKFSKYWQRYVYPFALMESHDVDVINLFSFYVLKWRERKGHASQFDIYTETYVYNHEDARERITNVCERFIEFLEANRNKITDKKIFGNE